MIGLTNGDGTGIVEVLFHGIWNQIKNSPAATLLEGGLTEIRYLVMYRETNVSRGNTESLMLSKI
jgi:hypothetical protein